MSARYLFLVAVAAMIGCASGSGGAGSSPAQAVPRKGDLLTAQEVALAHADVMNAYDAIARLRPNWLVSRGVSTFGSGTTEFAVVFVDGQQHGSLEPRRRFPAWPAREYRYSDVPQAGPDRKSA